MKQRGKLGAWDRYAMHAFVLADLALVATAAYFAWSLL